MIARKEHSIEEGHRGRTAITEHYGDEFHQQIDPRREQVRFRKYDLERDRQEEIVSKGYDSDFDRKIDYQKRQAPLEKSRPAYYCKMKSQEWLLKISEREFLKHKIKKEDFMKTRHLGLLIILLASTSIGHTDETIFNKIFIEKDEKKPEFTQYHNRVMLFTPGHIGYERIKPRGLYVGIEAFESPVFNKKHRKNLVNAELRLGHNFLYNGRDHLSPFVVVGVAGANHTHSFVDFDYRFKDWGIVYGGGGFLYAHEFDPVFSLGVNLKMFLGGSVCQNHEKFGTPVAGVDAAVPFTFRFGHEKRWDFRVEPFFFGLTGLKSTGYLGMRNSVGYRF